MASKKDPPNRRKSIAVTNQNKPTILPRSKRRPHSIVPGDRLSPFAKARRSLAPRKSILKASINILQTDSPPNSQSSTQSQIQLVPPSQSQSSNGDDTDAGSMEFTQDFRARVHDNPSRKSFGRRVSFADHAHVRVFEKDTNHTNSTGSPQSSPAQPSPEADRPVSDENAYPGARTRRRSSMRASMASSEGEDMDLTTIGPAFAITGSAIADEDLDYDDENEEDDMEVTEVMHGDFIRKRSLSMGIPRQPLSQLHAAQPEEEPSYSEEGSRSQSDIDPEQTQAMEFTIPLNQSLRPPAHHDEAWLALRQATHSGDTPYEQEPHSDDGEHQTHETELDDAMRRLLLARESLSQQSQDTTAEDIDFPAQGVIVEDDTFSSMEDSLRDGDGGDQTMNISKVLGRASLGVIGNERLSMGYPESTMDESEIYGSIAPPPPQQTQPQANPTPEPLPPAAPEPAVQPLLPKLTVFQPPPSNETVPSITQTQTVPEPQPSTITQPVFKSAIPIPFSFTPKAKALPPKSPSKTTSKPTFSAAFAPPTSRSTPKKSVGDSRVSPQKRPRPDNDGDLQSADADRPSPAKRLAIASKWSGGAPVPVSSSEPGASTEPRASPRKKAPSQTSGPAAPATRRTSGYFARRKSMGIGLSAKPVDRNPVPAPASRASPKKRVSMGSADTQAWARFDKQQAEAPPNTEPEPSVSQSIAVVVPSEEPARPSNGQTGGSPPSSPSPGFERLLIHVGPANRPQAGDIPMEDVTEEGQNSEQATHMESTGYVTEQWREGVEPFRPEEEEGEVFAPISIEQFFEMTNVKFMDEITAPRRSMHPSQRPMKQPRLPNDIPLAEYATAMGIDIPQLVLYTRVSKDLQAWMEQSRTVFAQAEEEAAKITPELFTEYSRADEEGQAELLHQLNLIRTNTRGLAKSDWYDWKLQWVDGLRVTADKALDALKTDARSLAGIKATVDECLPSLQQEYEEVLRDLEREQAEVAEIDACDQDYLNDLKTSILEQNIEVEARQAETAESNSQLQWLEDRLKEIEAQKLEATNAIADAQRILNIQQNGTRAEVFKLKDELEALEDLHMFRATKVSAELFEYTYASQYHISIPCKKFVPITRQITVSMLEKARSRYKDDFPRLTEFFLRTTTQILTNADCLTVREIVHELGDYWSCCSQLRSQLKLLSVRYPVTLEFSRPEEQAHFRATAMVTFPRVKAKADIAFLFPLDTFSRWPVSVDSLDCDVQIAYGPIDRGAIIKAVIDRIAQATPADNYACLLDACIEAQEIFN